jgi:hypothetical protein
VGRLRDGVVSGPLGPGAVSLLEVGACFETVPDTTCSGSDASTAFVPAGYLTGLTLVEYVVPPGAPAFAPGNQLPPGAQLLCKMSDGSTCPGSLTAAVGGVVQVPASEVTFGVPVPFQPPFDFSQLSSSTIGDAFAAGFLLVAGGFFIGKPISILVNMIRG